MANAGAFEIIIHALFKKDKNDDVEKILIKMMTRRVFTPDFHIKLSLMLLYMVHE